MAELEVVIKMGIEGGGATIRRKPNGPDDWAYHVDTGGIFLDDNDDEQWSFHELPTVPSIEEALNQVAGDGFWIDFYPTYIHLDYRARVWEIVQRTVQEQPAKKRSSGRKGREGRWKHACLAPSVE
jgi:hypothetical protein